ncbi:MAG TPA: Mpo1-like protein [Burkholderiales bacterium]|nr:Mpo1-like protein [Burkholderiales bacterium]
MKTLEDQMSFYAAYHQDARNKATHFVGVPMIIVSLLIPLAWLRVDIGGFAITGAMVFVAVVLAYYFFLDVPLALATAAFTIAFLVAADWIARQGALAGWTGFAVLFVGGWIIQLVGHAFEGRKPALADNLFQIFIAPIFLCAELFFALGYKPKLHAAVQERAMRMRAASSGTPAAA